MSSAALKAEAFLPPVLETIPIYRFPAAGMYWSIPNVEIDAGYDGRPVLPGREIRRITHAIANEICATAAPLSPAELQYLCELTALYYVEVAEKLGVTRATVSHWLRKGRQVPLPHSLTLKKWFWAKLFPAAVTPELVFTVEELLDDARVLQRFHDEAVRLGLAEVVKPEMSVIG